jgi:hypothetical protein
VGVVGVGGSTAVMDSMRLQRRPVGSVVTGVWHRILFHVVPRGMLANWMAGLAGLER